MRCRQICLFEACDLPLKVGRLTNSPPKMVSRIAFFKFFALVASFGAASSAKTCPGTAKYTITFYGKWSNTTHPNAYPVGGAYFSTMIGCSHGSNYSIFSSSIKATPGVKEVAEIG